MLGRSPPLRSLALIGIALSITSVSSTNVGAAPPPVQIKASPPVTAAVGQLSSAYDVQVMLPESIEFVSISPPAAQDNRVIGAFTAIESTNSTIAVRNRGSPRTGNSRTMRDLCYVTNNRSNSAKSRSLIRSTRGSARGSDDGPATINA